MTELRALTVRAPWSAFIACGMKLTENRTWMTHHRGLVAIHAATAGDWNGFKHPAATETVQSAAGPWVDVRGAFVALAEIDDCHPYSAGCCTSPWADRDGGVWHWVLANVRPLSKPVPARGRLGLWPANPHAIEEINTQTGATR